MEDFVEIHDEVEIEDDLLEGIGPQIELDLGTGSNLVREFGNESFPVCEDYPGDSFEKVGEIDLDEGAQTPIEPVFSTSSVGNLTGEEPRKKRIKTTAGRLDLPLV